MITVAKHAGFCEGVARAVKLARENAPCYTLGALIHNRAVIGELRGEGVLCESDIGNIPPGATVVIRSHGAPPEVYDALRGHKVIDATCPYVTKNHRLAERLDGVVIICGDAEHEEVKALAAWCKNPRIIADSTALERLIVSENLKNAQVSLVAQTTIQQKVYECCVNFLKKHCTNAQIFDTICNATILRQREAANLAANSDIMLVVGDVTSANTRHLADICGEFCEVHLVEDAAQARTVTVPVGARVGLTAGASAPAKVIKEVEAVMEIKTTVSEETELSFEEMLESSFKTLTTGDKVSGVITAITPTELHIDLGTKHAGYIPVTELSEDPDYKVEDHIKVGDTIETFVMRVNDVEGTALLSKKRVDAVQTWEDIEAAKDAHNIVEGIVTEENKGGLVVSVRGVRVFIPASQSGVPKDGDLASMLRKKVKLYVTEVNRARRRVVGSIRAAQNDDRKIKSDEIWANIEEGKRYSGVVKSLTSYGAFVDIGGVDGMVHVSELSWSRVGQPSDVVNVGDPLDVYVLSFDPEKRKISLGHKDKSQNPWNVFVEKFNVGDVITVKVVKLAAFGAFCEIIPGVDGLIHISHISDQRINKPGDVLTEGQETEVKILEINQENKKVSLSIREAAHPEPEEEAAAEE
ncbi:bifunctional 4-hydroxy-3-methylbut-2-enyl diphosphate reductase/30S ribosomal protein S1 [Clostridia bacterium]|nr:bifunctional 4-hydroxy-3-methylbut-2-enyl diphosphate reductase/30S ribosomal protein S1 [Clostridia bacterium]